MYALSTTSGAATPVAGGGFNIEGLVWDSRQQQMLALQTDPFAVTTVGTAVKIDMVTRLLTVVAALPLLGKDQPSLGHRRWRNQ